MFSFLLLRSMVPILKPRFDAPPAESHFFRGSKTAFLRLQFLISILLSLSRVPALSVSDTFWPLTTTWMLLAQIGRQSVRRSPPPLHTNRSLGTTGAATEFVYADDIEVGVRRVS